jgi:glutamate-1-semialdehyde 2,1-aminomutase
MDDEAYLSRTPGSREWMGRAAAVMPGGNTRSAAHHEPYPLTITHGDGPLLWDVDGNSYVDFANNFTSLVHAHAYPPVVRAVRRAVDHGTAWPALNPAQVELAELLCDRLPSVERVRYTNSGTEAALLALKLAGAVTGRHRMLKASTGYHGLDPSIVDTPAGPVSNTLVAEFNNAASFEAMLDQHADSIAAVFLEPVQSAGGVVAADPDFLRRVQSAAARAGALFVLDEVVTLRLAAGGLQAAWGIQPDLTLLGKIIGGGFPVGALAGRADLLDWLDPRTDRLRHAGTYNGNPITCRAGEVTLKELTPDRIGRMARLAERLEAGLAKAAAEVGLALAIRRHGSLLNLYRQPEPPAIGRGREDGLRMERLHRAALTRGVFFAPRGLMCLSTVMDEALVDLTVERMTLAMHDVGPDR